MTTCRMNNLEIDLNFVQPWCNPLRLTGLKTPANCFSIKLFHALSSGKHMYGDNRQWAALSINPRRYTPLNITSILHFRSVHTAGCENNCMKLVNKVFCFTGKLHTPIACTKKCFVHTTVHITAKNKKTKLRHDQQMASACTQLPIKSVSLFSEKGY